MSDPFSVTGTAVGITSLGIQVCQGLIQYYGDFKSFDDEISTTLTNVCNLDANLNALSTILATKRLENVIISGSLQSAMQTCDERLRKLETIVNKCGRCPTRGQSVDQLKSFMRRVRWPFRKETLKETIQAVGEAEKALSLVLQVLGIDSIHQLSQAMETKTDVILHHRRNVERSVAQQTDVLNDVSHGVQNLGLGQSQQTGTIISRMDADKQVMLERFQALEMQLMKLNAHQTALATPPSLLKESCDSLQTLDPAVNYESINSNRNFQKLSRARNVCTCNNQYRTNPRSYAGRSWATFWETNPTHAPSCPLSRYKEQQTTFGLHFTVWRRFLGYCVQASFTYTRGAGAMSITPFLGGCITVVDEFFPVFKPSFALDQISLDIRLPKNGDILRVVLRETLNALRDSSSRRVILYNGDNIMTTAFTALEHVLQMDPSLLPEFVGGLQAFMEIIGPGNELNPKVLRKLFECSSENTNPNQVAKAVITSIPISGKTHLGFPNWEECNAIARLISWLQIPESCEVFHCHSWLLAVAEKSQNKLKMLLEDSEGIKSLTLSDGNNILSWAIFWPEGLKMFLQHWKSNPFCSMTTDLDPWENYSTMKNIVKLESFETVKILWEYLGPIDLLYLLSWTKSANHFFENLVQFFAEQYLPAYRILFFSQGDLEVEEEKILEDTIKKGYYKNLSNLQNALGNIYRDRYGYQLEPRRLQTLFDAGFNRVDAPRSGDEPDPVINCCNLCNDLNTLHWLISHGTAFDQIAINSCTTGAHVIAKRLAYDQTVRTSSKVVTEESTENSTEESSFNFLQTVVLSQSFTDDCKCYCANSGCHVVTSYLNQMSIYESMEGSLYLPSLVHNWINSRRDIYSWMAPAVLRAWTFELLDLTHTCCGIFNRYADCTCMGSGQGSYTDDEIRDIHYTESKDVEILESLMAELEERWAKWDNTFFHFLETVWKPRMEELLAEDDIVECTENVKNTGVKLWEPCDMQSQEPSEEISAHYPNPWNIKGLELDWYEKWFIDRGIELPPPSDNDLEILELQRRN